MPFVQIAFSSDEGSGRSDAAKLSGFALVTASVSGASKTSAQFLDIVSRLGGQESKVAGVFDFVARQDSC